MQTFRAYLQDDAGKITWAAWIEAAHQAEAEGMAAAMRLDRTPTLELWSATTRTIADPSRLEPV